MKKWFIFLIKLALTVACLWWALSRQKIRDELGRSVSAWPEYPAWEWALLGIVLGGLTVVLSAFRWWVLLRAQQIPVRLWRVVELTLIGGLFNLFGVSSVTGDAAKIFLLIREHPERKLAVTMTVMVDHLVGLVAMALVFFALTAGSFGALPAQSLLGKGVIHFAWFFFAGGVTFVALFFLMASPWVNERIHRRVSNPRIARMRRVPEIYDVYRKKWRHALLALAASVVMLPVYYATPWCGTRVIEQGASFWDVFTVMPVVDAVSAMPLSIAGIGAREVSFQTLMQDLSGMRPGVAVLGSLIGFASGTLFWAFAGGLLFLRPADRTSMKEIEEITHEQA